MIEIVDSFRNNNENVLVLSIAEQSCLIRLETVLFDEMPEIYRDLLTCVVCHRGGDSIKQCSKCFSVAYCGRECQVGDWARHKRLCVPVMVKDFGEKGRGLVASKNFQVKDIIFKDTSVASIIFADESYNSDCAIVAKYGKEVYAQISKLSDADQKTFFELSGSPIIDGISSHGIIPEKYKRAYSIHRNNKIASGEKEEQLYLKFSMLNHSCDPNTITNSPDFSGKSMEVRAIKEIQVGEEVTTSYIDALTATLREKKEKEVLLKNWSFQCKCDICLQPETDRIKKLRIEWREGMLKEKTMFDAMNNSKEQSKFLILQKFANSLNQCVDFIIKVDNPFLSFYSKNVYCYLLGAGLTAGRLDLQRKGKSLLKKFFFGDIDKFMNHRMKMMMMKTN